MIRKLFQRVFSRAPAASPTADPALKIIARKQHGIAREHVSAGALKVTSGLQAAGYQAFVVGGAARDLLLGIAPKDYDVATDATPEQVRAVFRRSRIIGRRFRLVHVMCGAETVEVSTFRGSVVNDDNADQKTSDEHGRILRDNIFGTQIEDALRRDFTANALFYDPAREEIWDYLNGYADIRAKRLRIIGDPQQRYREDPVRMLRAVRLSAKLGLVMDDATAAPISDLAPLLQNVPSSRLFDEMLKLLLSGHSLACLIELRTRGLHHGLLPMLDVILEQPMGEHFAVLALKNTDQRVLEDKPVSPGFLFATLLWHEVLAAWQHLEKGGERPMPALFQAMDQVLKIQDKNLAIPRRYDAIMKEIWALQPRFVARSGRRPQRLLEHPRFRAAYDFMVLRCDSGEGGEFNSELADWWTKFQRVSAEERDAMLAVDQPPKKRRRSRGRSGDSGGKKNTPDNGNSHEQGSLFAADVGEKG